MRRTLSAKLKQDRGISRAAVILIVAVAVMLVVVSVPTLLHWRDVSRKLGCMSAMDTANRELRLAYIAASGHLSYDEAKEEVAKSMGGLEDICPGGGTVQLIEVEDTGLPYKLVCGMHDADEKERTRANAAYALEYVRERARLEMVSTGSAPEEITLSLNGKSLTVRLSEEKTEFRHGTHYLVDWEGEPVAAFYCARGAAVTYFAYADEKYSAMWDEVLGWTGDSHLYS